MGSWLEPFRAGTAGGEELIEVDGCIFGSVFEAEGDFFVAQTRLGQRSIRGDAAVA